MGERRTGKETNVSPLLLHADDKLDAILVDDETFKFDPPWTSPRIGRPVVEIDFDAGTARVVGFREIVDIPEVLRASLGALGAGLEVLGTLNNGESFAILVSMAWREISGDEELPNPLEQATRIIEALAFAWDQGFDPSAPYERISKEISDGL